MQVEYYFEDGSEFDFNKVKKKPNKPVMQNVLIVIIKYNGRSIQRTAISGSFFFFNFYAKPHVIHQHFDNQRRMDEPKGMISKNSWNTTLYS